MKSLKKIISAVLLIVLFVFSPPTAKAADVYMGTYDSGLDAYLMEETIEDGLHRSFDVQIKAIGQDGLIVYVDYHFWIDRPDGRIVPMFSNSQGYRDKVSEATPVEKNIWRYVRPGM